MRIENWSLCTTLFDPYKPPELHAKKVHGNVYGHPTYPDGEEITTSRIIEVNAATHTVKTVSGSVYELGAVDPGYEEAYPGASVRLFKE